MEREKLFDTLYFGYPLRTAGPPFDLQPQQQTDAPDLKRLKNICLEAASRLLGTDTEVVLPLSGGLDSRFILGCIRELLPANRIFAFNYGTAGQLDYDIPPVIASHCGIRLIQVPYENIAISIDDVWQHHYSLDSTPAHNLIGFIVTRTASTTALELLGFDNTVPVWSGFLGDRVFAGKWSGEQTSLKDACQRFAAAYSVNKTPALSLPNYDPVFRLAAVLKNQKSSGGWNWLEYLELAQRQYRVRASLQTLDNPYAFLFEQPEVISAIYSVPEKYRKGGDLQRMCLHRFFPDLCRLPVTSRFGYPLGKNAMTEKFDRLVRLSSARIDRLLGTRFEKFKRRKMTVPLLKQLIGGYGDVMDKGLIHTISMLNKWDVIITEEQLSQLTANRSRCEQFASLGYLAGA